VYARAPTQAVVLVTASARALQRQSLSSAENALLFCVVAKKCRFHRCFCTAGFFSLKLDWLARSPCKRPKSHRNAARSTSIKHVEKIFARAPARGLRSVDFDRNRANRSKVIR
jgi:hypothetical protein